jgi:hypothetical protein
MTQRIRTAADARQLDVALMGDQLAVQTLPLHLPHLYKIQNRQYSLNRGSMGFDIYQLKEEEFDEEQLRQYEDTLIDLFMNSPEGQALLKEYPGAGFWVHSLISYGSGYTGVTIPNMEVHYIDELLSELFPRKITLSSPDDADSAIPELIYFWEYLHREYQLPNSEPILDYLRELDPKEFKEWMNDPENFGMAKSFFMMGQKAGFDMTDQKDMDAFMHLYNASLPHRHASSESETAGQKIGKKNDRAKAKRLRNIARESRKKNRKRK